MADQYQHEYDEAADILGCATLLATRRKCELDLDILRKKEPSNYEARAQVMAMLAHVRVMLEMYPTEVIAKATYVFEYVLKRYNED